MIIIIMENFHPLIPVLLHPGILCRILPTVYGPGWLTPDPPNHGTWPSIPDGFAVAQAVVEKLSLGAWGGMPYKERKRRCKNRLKGKWLGL